jgi:hypothetical protein
VTSGSKAPTGPPSLPLNERGHFRYLRLSFRRFGLCFSNTGIWRFMKASNIGTVNAVSPCLWLQTMPLSMSCCRTVATAAALTPSVAAMSPVYETIIFKLVRLMEHLLTPLI